MKKILILACIFSLYSCKNSTTNDKTSIYSDETVLIVNYQIENMSMDEHAKLGSAVAPNFTSENVPGLLGKSFIGDAERGVFGGVYYFSDSESVDIYLESDLWKGVVAHPNLVNFKTDILGLINFKAPIYQEALNQINNIKNNQSTPLASIHFRRTDYLEVSSLNLSTDYYAKALTTLSENIGAFKLLVFSDDIEWCKNNIEHDDNVFFIENNTNYVDMCMMTLCDHNIIANSTFSWWGAYLNKNPDSLTICPMNYIGDENHFLNKNYYPHNWISLKEK